MARCSNFLIWKLGDCGVATRNVSVDPKYVTDLTDLIYGAFKDRIKTVNITGYTIQDILGGSDNCPQQFDPSQAVTVDQLGQLTPDEVLLLDRMISNMLFSSARQISSNDQFIATLMSNQITLEQLVRLINSEVSSVVTPSVISLLISTTQPNPPGKITSFNTGIIVNGLCTVNPRLPIIVFAASLLEHITKSLTSNTTFNTLFNKLIAVTPAVDQSRSRSHVTNGAIWFIIIIAVLVLVGAWWLVSRDSINI